MGKKNNKKQACGQALYKHFRKQHNLTPGSTAIHPAQLKEDDRQAERIRFQSKPEETVEEAVIFKIQADPTRSFAAGRLNDGFAFPDKINLTEEEEAIVREAQSLEKSSLQIPRRPKWDKSMDAQELDEVEIDSFNSWRRILSALNDKKHIKLTPYEKNIEFWRQLWRVSERSDVLVQIVDARDPLLYYSEDLKNYVFEHGPHRKHLVLLNKADFLTDSQKKAWAEYFKSVNLDVAFFSALTEENVLQQTEKEGKQSEKEVNQTEEEVNQTEEEGKQTEEEINQTEEEEKQTEEEVNQTEEEEKQTEEGEVINNAELEAEQPFKAEDYINKPVTLDRIQLEKLFESYDHPRRCNENFLTIGLIGYPNVGKSSTINCLLQGKKVAVSTTPGKTKHFQTHFLSNGLVLCDCPGLILPAFVCDKSEMVVSGILPIDQMKDFAGPVGAVVKRIPRHILESTFGIKLPISASTDDIRVKVEELLNNYGGSRGFMAQGGMPDRVKAAREILKQFVSGQILYCKAPPNKLQEEYFESKPIKERKLNLRPIRHVKVKASANLNSNIGGDANMINNPRGRTKIPKEEGKWWREELKSKRNVHVKLRNRFPQDY